MNFGVLGPLTAWDEGRELPLGSAKQRAVLAVLLLHANEPVSMPRLVDDLWPSPPPTAAKAVQGYVWQLRKALGGGAIVTWPSGYALQLGDHALDAQRFESFTEQGRRLLAAGAAEAAAAVLRKGLALWRGPALADFQYEAFARDEIRRLEELRLATHELRLEAELTLGGARGVVAELEGLVQAHPARESLRELLMLALYRAGRQADALAVYHETRGLLVGELGLEPSESLRRLEQAILRRDPALDLDAVSSSSSQTAIARAGDASGEARKVVTVVFCDIGAGTMLGERLDPESLRLVVSRYFDAVAAAVERHGGTVEKFVGDEVMAIFGIPAVHEDDALRAVSAALEIRDALPRLGVDARIGVSTGEVLVTDPAAGSGSVTGHAVVVGKRLEEAAAPGEVLIGEQSFALVRDAVDIVPLEPLVQRAPAEPIAAYRALRVREAAERQHRMRLVGRARELAQLTELRERVELERRCELVTIVGDAGIGKSRLAAELLASSDALVARGQCVPYGEGITYWPVVEVLRQLDVLPEDEHAAAAIRSLLAASDSVARAEDIAWAFRKTLERAAARRLLVVVFDDVHWGEETFLALLEQVAFLSSDAPILLLCLTRPELLERRPSPTAVIELGPLGASEVDALIPERISGDLRGRIARSAGGNPLYIEELLAMADESQGELAVPPTLRALLTARLDALDPGERSALELAAVEGETFHLAAVGELAADDAEPATHLAALVRKGLISPHRMLAGEDGFRFSHQLIRDAAYERLPKRTRAALHERFGAWLEANAAGLVALDELVGYHLEQAYRYRSELEPDGDDAPTLAGRAAASLGAAGRRAVERGDVPAAVNLLRRATELLPADSVERLQLLRPYNYAVHQSGRIVEALAINQELYERATAIGERGLAAHARSSSVAPRVFADPGVDLDEAWAACEEAIATFTELGDEAGLATSMRGLGTICRIRGREGEAAAWMDRALVHANASRDPITRRVVIQAAAMPLRNGPMPVDDAIRRCEELRDTNTDDRVLDAAITRVLSSLYAMAGRFDDVRRSWERAGEVLDETNLLGHSSATQVHSADAKELAGDRAGAERELKATWLAFRDTRGGAPNARAMGAACDLARFYCDEGRWDEAEECLAYHRDVAAPGHVVLAAWRLAVTARFLAHRGELAAATDLAERAVEVAESTDMPNVRAAAWLALAEVTRAGDRTAEADVAMATALELYEQKGNVAAAERLRGTSAVLA